MALIIWLGFLPKLCQKSRRDAELIAQHDAKFTAVTKTEETYTPCWDQRDPYAGCKFEKKDITYPAIYLPSYWEVPKYDGTDDEGVMAVQSEAEQVGNDTRMLPVNEFLFHFKEIFLLDFALVTLVTLTAFGVTVNFLLGVKDKIEMEDNSRTAILFRKAEQVDPKEKEKLLDILDSTIDIFLGKNNNG